MGVNRGRILDLGAGVGGVSLCLAARLNKVQITAVELDPVLVALAQKNILRTVLRTVCVSCQVIFRHCRQLLEVVLTMSSVTRLIIL